MGNKNFHEVIKYYKGKPRNLLQNSYNRLRILNAGINKNYAKKFKL